MDGTTATGKNPTVRRILRELAEFAADTSSTYALTAPDDGNLFNLHFTIRGPAGTPFAAGTYHGQLILPHDYPYKPPEIIFLTPTGRFEVRKKICLSVSDYHPEEWQPAWGLRTVLIGVASFMDGESEGAIGSVTWTSEERLKLALESNSWTCPECRIPNAELLPAPESKGQTLGASPNKQPFGFKYAPSPLPPLASEETKAADLPPLHEDETIPQQPARINEDNRRPLVVLEAARNVNQDLVDSPVPTKGSPASPEKRISSNSTKSSSSTSFPPTSSPRARTTSNRSTSQASQSSALLRDHPASTSSRMNAQSDARRRQALLDIITYALMAILVAIIFRRLF